MTPTDRHLLGTVSRLLCEGTERQPDAELLERFALGRDETAFRALVDRYGNLVFGACRRVLRDVQEAEDAFQATFLVLARKAGSLQKKEALAGWLFGVARRLSLRARARAAARRRRDSVERPALPEPAPGEDLSWREMLQTLDEELARLSEKHRAPLVLCYLQGKTQDEAAQQLGWSKSTCRRRLEEGRRVLLARLARRGVTLSAALGTAALAAAANARPLDSLTAATVTAALAGTSSAGGAAAPALLARWGLWAVTRSQLKAALWTAALLGALGTGLLAWYVLAGGPHAGDPSGARQPAGPEKPAGAAEKGKPTVDLDGDPLPAGAVARLGALRWSQLGRCLAYSPDGKLLAVGKVRGVSLMEAATGRELRVLAEETWSVPAVAFSPDGAALAVADADNAALWDVRTGKRLRQFGTALRGVSALAFSPDGKLLATAGHTARLWDADSAKELRPLENGRGPYRCVAFSPDGKSLAAADADRVVRVWDVPSGDERLHLTGHTQLVRGVAFSPDGKLLATGSGTEGVAGLPQDTTLRLWDADTGKDLQRFGPSPRGTAPLAFSPDGKTLYSAGDDTVVRSWEVGTGKESRALGNCLSPQAMALSADGRSLGVLGVTACLWDTDGEGKTTKEGETPGRLRFGKDRLLETGHRRRITGLAFLADGKHLVSTGWDGTVRLWDLKGRLLKLETDAGLWVSALDVAADGKSFVTAGNLVPVRVWDPATFTPTRSWEARGFAVWSAALSADGKVLVTAGDGFAGYVRWDPATGKEVRRFTAPAAPANPLALSPDGALLVAAGDKGTPQLLETATGRLAGPVGAGVAGYRAAFSPDGRTLAVAARTAAGGTEVILYEVATRAERGRLPGPKTGVWTLAFSPDGRLLAGGGRDAPTVSLWDVTTGATLAESAAHGRGQVCVAFSPDGRLLGTGDDAGLGLIWDVGRLAGKGPPPRQALAAEQLPALWDDLAGADAARAARAVRALADDPRHSVPFLGRRLAGVALPEEAEVASLLAGLDDDQFATRQRCADALARAGGLAEPRLRKALAGDLTPEVRRRVEQLLTQLEGPPSAGEEIPLLRAVEVLAQVGGAEAEGLLAGLAKNLPGTRVGREAEKAGALSSRRRSAAE
jgi:RNA polymerase sigma factor (sigma-70 family)